MGQGQDSPEAKTWNVEVAMGVVNSFVPNLQPQRIVEALDQEDFYMPDHEGLQILMKAWKKLSADPFPVQVGIFAASLQHHGKKNIRPYCLDQAN